jgi:PBSX family phage portal protein
MTDRRIQAYVFDSASGAVARINSPVLAGAVSELAAHHEVVKAITDPSSRGSRRLRQKYGVQVGGVSCASRPFDMALFAYAMTLNTYHARAVRAKVKDITGRPWVIAGESSPAAKTIIERFFREAFGRRSFAQGMGCVWTDYEGLGNGYMEVVTDPRGEPAALEHLPATEMWVRLDGLGYVQQRGGETAHFRVWGLDDEAYSELPAEDPLAAGKPATHVIHFLRYSPWSQFYGLPAILPAWSAVCLSVLVNEYNLTFFQNNAIPDYAVILEGEVEEEAADVIRTYFRHHLKGQAHKTLVLESPSGSKIRFEKLTDSSAREGSFRLLRTDCRDEILHAHGVPPQKVGIVETGKLGGNLSSEQIREYQLSIVVPSQEEIASQMTDLIRRGFGLDGLRFEFLPADIEDRKLDAEIDQIYLQNRVLVPNEVRAKRFPDAAPLPGGDEPVGAPSMADLAGLDQTMGDLQRQIREAVRS